MRAPFTRQVIRAAKGTVSEALQNSGTARRITGAVTDAGERLADALKLGVPDPVALRTRYPETARPTVQPRDAGTVQGGPTREGYFAQKAKTPEEKAVERARNRATREMSRDGYEPMFDLEQRFDVDPANYPDVPTGADFPRPKTQATIDKYREGYGSPEVRARLQKYFDEGSMDPDAVDWYAVGQLEDAYISELGPELGRSRFDEDFATQMATTTGGASPQTNFLAAMYANYNRARGIDMPRKMEINMGRRQQGPPEAGYDEVRYPSGTLSKTRPALNRHGRQEVASYDIPHPVGGRFMGGNLDLAERVGGGEPMTPLGQPKRSSFRGDFLGGDTGTLDEQMMKPTDVKGLAPPGDSYGVYHDVIEELAAENEVSAKNFQGPSWTAIKGEAGKSMMQVINESIERTARITGQTPEEVLRAMIRDRAPMYGGAGLAAGGGGLGQAMSQKQNGGGGY